MVVIRLEKLFGIAAWDPMNEDVVHGLQVEGFLDFSVGREEEVEEDGGGYESQEGP